MSDLVGSLEDRVFRDAALLVQELSSGKSSEVNLFLVEKRYKKYCQNMTEPLTVCSSSHQQKQNISGDCILNLSLSDLDSRALCAFFEEKNTSNKK